MAISEENKKLQATENILAENIFVLTSAAFFAVDPNYHPHPLDQIRDKAIVRFSVPKEVAMFHVELKCTVGAKPVMLNVFIRDLIIRMI